MYANLYSLLWRVKLGSKVQSVTLKYFQSFCNGAFMCDGILMIIRLWYILYHISFHCLLKVCTQRRLLSFPCNLETVLTSYQSLFFKDENIVELFLMDNLQDIQPNFSIQLGGLMVPYKLYLNIATLSISLNSYQSFMCEVNSGFMYLLY